jgi:hypothetical protein
MGKMHAIRVMFAGDGASVFAFARLKRWCTLSKHGTKNLIKIKETP